MRSRLPVADASPSGSRLGLGLLVPGLPQWGWGQRERSLMLSASFASALILAVLGWGSGLGLSMFVCAYGVHVLSLHDSLRQALYPGLGRFAPTLLSASTVAVAFYVPTLLVASTYAWPGRAPNGRAAYLIDRTAFRRLEPRAGDFVWVKGKAEANHGRVLALSGQEVLWIERRLRIDGEISLLRPFSSGAAPEQFAFRVPEGHLLVAFNPASAEGERWRLVSRDDVQGRAWASIPSLWNRRVLD